jgi:superfamily II DNA or RNA helicase
MIYIKHLNHSFVVLENLSDSEKNEIAESYTFFADGFKFHPSYKKGQWDGKIRMFNRGNRTLPRGLVDDLLDKLDSWGYPYTVDQTLLSDEPLTFDEKSMRLKYGMFYYQKEMVEYALEHRRGICIAATSSGKSLVQAAIAKRLADEGLNVLFIVPNVSLIAQMYSDMQDYFSNSDYDIPSNVHKIYAGKDKHTKKLITLSTWQSLQNLESEYFHKFDAVICDECHLATGKQLQKITASCINASYRLGFTGTLKGGKANELTVIGNFGQPKRFVTAKTLIDEGTITPIRIKAVAIQYPDEVCRPATGLPYKDELKVILKNQKRMKVVAGIAAKAKGNTLVLVSLVEKFGVPLREVIQKIAPDKKVVLVTGDTKVADREDLRREVETSDNIVIVATYQLFSTGVSIKRLHNVIFAHPTKSAVRVLQSIGRGLRKHELKEKMILYDIVDDLRLQGKGKKNYCLTHFEERYTIYSEQQFPVTVTKVCL